MKRKWAVCVAVAAFLTVMLMTTASVLGAQLEGPGGGCAPRLFSGPPGQSGIFYGHGYGDLNAVHLGPAPQFVPVPNSGG